MSHEALKEQKEAALNHTAVEESNESISKRIVCLRIQKNSFMFEELRYKSRKLLLSKVITKKPWLDAR